MKYKPKTYKENLAFDDGFCNRCVHDANFRKSEGKREGCEILAAVLVEKVDSDDYPPEWISDEDGSNPRCTNFKEAWI